MIDQVIGAGSYRVGRLLARGGMAHVRLGLDVRSGRAVAVKYLNAESLRDENARRLFQAEATTAGLDHPGVVRVLDSGTAEDLATGAAIPYIVMEFVPGDSLRTVLRRDGALGLDEALDLAVQLLEALAYCHAAGLVHRDIKPSNVMVTPSGRVRLVDFGVARHVGDATEQLDDTSRFVTTAYASPEQAQRLPTDSRSDLYSVGCVLYELLTGRPPFVGEEQDVLFERLVDEPKAPSVHNREVSPELDAVVLRSLRRDPADRYPSAEAMTEDLEGVVRSRRAPAHPPVVPRDVPAAASADWPAVTVLRPARPARRRRTVRLMSGVAAALLPLAGFGAFHLQGPDRLDAAAMALSLGGVSGGSAAAGGSGSDIWSPPPALRSTAWVDQSCELAADGEVLPASGAVQGVTAAATVTIAHAAAGRSGAAAAATRSGMQPVGVTARPGPRKQPAVSAPKPVKPKPVKRAEPAPKPSKPVPPVKPGPSKPVDPPKPDKPVDPPKPSKPKPSKPDKPKPTKPKPSQAESPSPTSRSPSPTSRSPSPTSRSPSRTSRRTSPSRTSPSPTSRTSRQAGQAEEQAQAGQAVIRVRHVSTAADDRRPASAAAEAENPSQGS